MIATIATRMMLSLVRLDAAIAASRWLAALKPTSSAEEQGHPTPGQDQRPATYMRHALCGVGSAPRR
jgi:hypothetical protein